MKTENISVNSILITVRSTILHVAICKITLSDTESFVNTYHIGPSTIAVLPGVFS